MHNTWHANHAKTSSMRRMPFDVRSWALGAIVNVSHEFRMPPCNEICETILDMCSCTRVTNSEDPTYALPISVYSVDMLQVMCFDACSTNQHLPSRRLKQKYMNQADKAGIVNKRPSAR
jgi:hypothetical protein